MCDSIKSVDVKLDFKVVSDVPGETRQNFNGKINDAVVFSGLTYDRVSSQTPLHLVVYKNTIGLRQRQVTMKLTV